MRIIQTYIHHLKRLQCRLFGHRKRYGNRVDGLGHLQYRCARCGFNGYDKLDVESERRIAEERRKNHV